MSSSSDYHPQNHWYETESEANIIVIDHNGNKIDSLLLASYEGAELGGDDWIKFHRFLLNEQDDQHHLIAHYSEIESYGGDRGFYFGTVSLPELNLIGDFELPHNRRNYHLLIRFEQEEQDEARSYLLGFYNEFIDILDIDDFTILNQVRLEPALATGIIFDNLDDDEEYELVYLSPDAITYYDLGRLGVDTDNDFAYTPTTILLNPAYPNPFNSTVTVPYSLPIASNVRISVYDLQGNEISLLHEGHKLQGNHNIMWNPQSTPSGTYMVRVGMANSVSMVPVMLVK